MAANYWISTQRLHWRFTREELLDTREVLEEQDRVSVQQYALLDRRLLSIFFKERRFPLPWECLHSVKAVLIAWQKSESLGDG